MRRGQLQCRISQLMPELLALVARVDRDRPKQDAVSVQLERRRADDVFAFSRNEHGRQMLLDGGERQMQALEQGTDPGQVPLRRGFDHDCDSVYRLSIRNEMANPT